MLGVVGVVVGEPEALDALEGRARLGGMSGKQRIFRKKEISRYLAISL